MDRTAQIFIALTAYIIICHGAPSESSVSTEPTDPKVFEMESPPGFMKFLPTKDEEMNNPMKIPFSPAQMSEIAKNMKFQHWYNFSHMKPQFGIQVDKKKPENDTDLEITPDDSEISWSDFIHVDPSLEDKLDAKDVFPPYYNVFLSNAYPSWMAMPGFSTDGMKDKTNDAELKTSNIKVNTETENKGSSVIENGKVAEYNGEDTSKIKDEKVEPLSKFSSADGENIKLSKNMESFDNDIKILSDPHTIIFPENSENKIVQINKQPSESIEQNQPFLIEDVKSSIQGESISSKLNPDSQQVKAKAPNLVVNSNAEKSNSDMKEIILTKRINQNQEKIPEPVKITSKLDESDETKPNQGKNLMPDNFLYNLLQQVKPMLSSVNGIKATDIDLQDLPKPQTKSVILDSNIAINNEKKLANVNARPLPNRSPPKNGALAQVLQNMNPQPLYDNMPGNQAASPFDGASNQPYLFNRNQENAPINPSPNNYVVPYGNNMNQNNYMQNPGQSMVSTIPYNTNNNYGFANTGTQLPYQGNLNNGQTLLQGNTIPFNSNNMAMVYPGINNNNGNMGYVSPGMNTQNLYALIPITNMGNVANVNTVPNQYLSMNPQLSPSGNQVSSSLPLYNFVPLKTGASSLVNTKDEDE